MEVQRSLVEQGVVLSDKLSANTLRGGRFHDHYKHLNIQQSDQTRMLTVSCVTVLSSVPLTLTLYQTFKIIT